MRGWMYQEEGSGPHLTAPLLTLGLPTQIASQTGTSPSNRYSDSMKEKKKEKYIERVQNVERANFTPLVFMTTGGMGPECLKFINRLGSKISAKKNEQYHQVIRCLRLKLRCALLRSFLIALRGFRGKHYKKDVPISEIAFNILPHTAWAE